MKTRVDVLTENFAPAVKAVVYIPPVEYLQAAIASKVAQVALRGEGQEAIGPEQRPSTPKLTAPATGQAP